MCRSGRAVKYHQLENGQFIPKAVFERVQRQPGESLPLTGEGFYRRYVELKYLKPYFAIPFFLVLFVMLLYVLGKFMAVGIGEMASGAVDRFVLHLPGVRAVYSAVKQVTDFLFSERELRVTRVVAVEFPAQGRLVDRFRYRRKPVGDLRRRRRAGA